MPLYLACTNHAHSPGLIALHTVTLTCLQVHGGVTEKDIETFLEVAMEQAKDNHGRNLDTVVFFDEANTTDAIGLIKEIMCDRRLHGKPIPEDLKFIAACNPYRRFLCDHMY